MKGFARRLIDCKDYYCSISSEAKWLNSKKWAVGNLFFNYRRQITVTEQSGNDLADYQVLIELDSTNFDFSHANEDGSDIRFYDGSNLYPYWIEKWDNINQEAKIWVKIPSIPANSSTSFYMYYGNSNIMNESNAEQVFLIYANFEECNLGNDGSCEGFLPDNSSYWEVIDDGSNRVYKGSYSGHSKSVNDVGGLDNIEIKVKVKCLSTGQYNAYIMGRYVSSEELYEVQLDFNTPSLKLRRRHPTDPAILVEKSYSLTKEIWYDVWFRLYENNLKVYINGNEELSSTDTFYDSGKTGLHVYNADILFDNFIVRKYVEPEPNVNIGNEETP